MPIIKESMVKSLTFDKPFREGKHITLSSQALANNTEPLIKMEMATSF